MHTLTHRVAAFILISGVIVALIVSLSVPLTAVHADSPIAITDHTTESNFRQSFIFHVKAISVGGKITGARVRWHERGSNASQVLPVSSFTPAASVDLSYTVDTRTMTTPAWQIVLYSWELSDDAGNTFQSPDYEAEFADQTHPWKKVSDGKVAVYYYEQTDDFGKQLLTVAQTGYAHVSKATGQTPSGELRIVIYNSQADFCAFFVPGDCPDWMGGRTFNTLTAQWFTPGDVGDTNYLFNQMVPHEMAHAFLGEWMGPRVSAVPIWFNEGQAMNNQIDGIDAALARAHDLAHVGKLERLAFMEARATIGRNQLQSTSDWYAQATSLVAFLYDRYGTDILGKIVSKVNDGLTFQRAFTDATGLTFEQYELAWRAWLGSTGELPTIMPSPTFLPFPPTPTYPPKPGK